MTKTSKDALFLGVSALLAGLINGLLGAGGGIIAVWALSHVLSGQLSDRRDAFANALVIMLPLSAISAIGYGMRGLADSGELGILFIPAIIGGFCGALVLDKINIKWLKLIFAGIIIYSGLSMLF
ncbi:MAG: sulfite exporter TauE/SafE family protein [Clostridia bacterium]|nr:sulfite exporter TauE/SafE family protein [Clostridia bacterium]